MAKKATYGNESIKSLRGADRVRKRPAVIFGSDGLEGCEHSIFEIMSNSIGAVQVAGHHDPIAAPLSGLVYGVAHNFKDGMLTAL